MSGEPASKPTPEQPSQSEPKQPKAPEIRPDASTQGTSKKSADIIAIERRHKDQEK